ncbi:4Fe-4S binding protein [Runella zeae]|uniref:4Fe-4S binding protein n=1 Tax=Runella zeae TaxID=94255 RepID=UPI00041A3728|nr:4Fe-4S dicluster domain-containing protein [Runella zeae]
MKSIQRLGLIIFLLGFGLWLYTLSMNEFRLTTTILENNLKPEHQATLGKALQPLLNKTYTNGWLFTYEFDQIFNRLNNSYKAAQQWDKVIYDEYSFNITKASASGPLKTQPFLWLFLTFGLSIIGILLYILPDIQQLAGIKNNHIFQNGATSRGWIGWGVGTFLIFFYILLYYYPQYLVNWTILVDPISQSLNGGEASRWFLYGFLYTVCVAVMGIRMLIKYRHSRYQQWRTLSVVFFQTAIAFILPEILVSLNKPYYDFKNIWPLDYDFFFDYHLNSLIQSGGLGIFMLVWGILLFLVGVPIMTYFFGKRWYCSWVCGCGGLAETLGDPYRQLSDKSLKSWKIERYLIHGVLAFAVVMTAMVLYTYFTGSANVLFIDSNSVRSAYGFWIGGIFAGVVGTGFYPLMGNRVWCRFGCPLAAYLGLWQKKKSRFRITTNGGQCISCGNCSTYCEMGIDVRAYAQRGQDIVRSSCVGCGICSAVCPRGVLNLENASENSRVMIAPEILLGNDMNHQHRQS